MTTMSHLQSLGADDLTALGYIVALSLFRNMTKEDLVIIGLLFDNVSDIIETIVAIDAIQSKLLLDFAPPNALISNEQNTVAAANVQQDLQQAINGFHEIIEDFHEIIVDLQNQIASLRLEIQELQNNSGHRRP